MQADGVVQAVDVPPGTGTLTWHYAPPRLTAGLSISLVALVALLLLCGATRTRSRVGPACRFAGTACPGRSAREATWLPSRRYRR